MNDLRHPPLVALGAILLVGSSHLLGASTRTASAQAASQPLSPPTGQQPRPPVIRPSGPPPVVTPAQPPVVRPSTPPIEITDPELRQLHTDFQTLGTWIRRKGTIGPDEKREVNAFRERVDTFLNTHPDNVIALSMAYQAAIWSGDSAAAQSAFTRLEQARPGDDTLRLALARRRAMVHDWAAALKTIEERELKPETQVEIIGLRAQCLMGLNRYDEALAVLDSAGDPATLPPTVKGDVQRLRPIAEETAPLWEIENALRQQEAMMDDLPRVELMTVHGPIVIELFENQAPNTTANFISLVEQGFYDGTTFHRVIPGNMAQAGDPNTKPGSTEPPGRGGPGYRIPDEHKREDARKHFPGSIAMANAGTPDTGGSQFFICYVPLPRLNGNYTVFGRVLDGEDTVIKLSQNDRITGARVIRKRDHPYVPETLEALPTAPGPTVVPGIDGAPTRVTLPTPSR